MHNFAFKFQAVAEKTAKNVRGLLYFAAPCILVFHVSSFWLEIAYSGPNFGGFGGK